MVQTSMAGIGRSNGHRVESCNQYALVLWGSGPLSGEVPLYEEDLQRKRTLEKMPAWRLYRTLAGSVPRSSHETTAPPGWRISQNGTARNRGTSHPHRHTQMHQHLPDHGRSKRHNYVAMRRGRWPSHVRGNVAWQSPAKRSLGAVCAERTGCAEGQRAKEASR